MKTKRLKELEVRAGKRSLPFTTVDDARVEGYRLCLEDVEPVLPKAVDAANMLIELGNNPTDRTKDSARLREAYRIGQELRDALATLELGE